MTAHLVSLPANIPFPKWNRLVSFSFPSKREMCENLGLDGLHQFVRSTQVITDNVKHNARVGSDLLLLSRLPELNSQTMKLRLNKLDTVLEKIDRMLKQMDKLMQLLPPESTLKTVIEQLTRSQTTIALLLGLFVGWFTTFSWHQQRKPPLQQTLSTDAPPAPRTASTALNRSTSHRKETPA